MTMGARRAALAAWLLAGLSVGAAPTELWAQSPVQANPRPAPARKVTAVDAVADAEVSEVVVTAGRTIYQSQPGAVIGDIEPELQLSPADVQSYGVSTVSELLNELAPQTRSDRGRGGETPVVLLNGRRISGFNEVRDIPTEAILRVDILPEEVALKYGFTADQRVVNIVLRRRFQAVTNEVQGGSPTEGGQVNGQAQADLFRVRGDNRINLDLKYQGASALTEDERGLTPLTSSQPYALGGNVISAAPGAQIDPALSALAGRPVTVAGVPAVAGRNLTLPDFAATAGAPNSGDIGRYRTLSPATQSISANMVLARTLPAGFSGTFNASLAANSSESLRGLPSLGLMVPAGDAFSPFGQAVKVDRYVDSLGPLRQDVDGWTAHLGGTLNRDLGRWRLSFTSAYDHADSQTNSDAGVDAVTLQALLNADSPSFNPFVAPSASLLTLLPRNVARSLSDSANAQVLANGPLLQVPAGPLNVSLKAGDSQSGFATRSQRLGVAQAISLSRNDFNAQANFDLPLASRRRNVLPMLGELSLNLNLAVDQISEFGALTKLGYGVNWTPITGVSLIVSHTRDGQAPSVQQLGNPTIATPGVRLLDYATGQTVDVTQIGGGNPTLTSDRRDVFKLGLTLKPIPTQDLSITANYVDTRDDNPIGSFPAATAQIEAAFADRFLRDATGQLIQVDNRPVNFAWQARKEIRWGINYSRPIGPPPPPRQARRAAPAADGQGQPPRQPRPGAGGDGPPGAAPDGPDRGPGPGAGGGRGGGGGGGGRGGGGQGRLQVAVYHTVFFTDQILLRPGGPLLDLLNGSAAGANGGQPRHQIEAQAGYNLNGLGARMSANWQSGTYIQGGAASPTGNLTFSDLATVNLRLFANLAQMTKTLERHPWLRGSRVTLSLNNLFDQRIRVTDASGATPLSYQAAYLDPTGRTVSLSFRKLFF